MTPGSPLQHDMADVDEKHVPRSAVDGSLPVPESIRIKNRRKRYLDLHPEYFGSDLELAGVLLNGPRFTNI